MPDGSIPQGSEFQGNPETLGNQFASTITTLADGGFVVSWMPFGQDGSIDGIFAQQYAAQYFGNAVDIWIYSRDGGDSLNGKKGVARSHIFEIGSAKNNVAGLEYEGTTITINRLDLEDICGADIII